MAPHRLHLTGFFSLAAMTAQAATLSLAPDLQTGLRVETLDATTCRIVCEIASIESESIELEGRSWNKLSLSEGAPSLVAGAPDLPTLSLSLAVGGEGIRRVRVVEQEELLLEAFPVAPSRGNLSRLADPATAPWVFGEAYERAQSWPESSWQTSETFQFRDVQGQSLRLQPFRYDAASEELTVQTRLVLEVDLDPAPPVDPAVHELDATFLEIYKNHFHNWGGLRYDYMPAVGSMLVLCPDEWLPELQPFVEWKTRLGLQTTLVPLSVTGSTSADIYTWLEDQWLVNPYTFVTLVGDHQQLPSKLFYGSAADASYGMFLGGDQYPEAIIGRFSAQNIEDLQVQLERTHRYTMEPDPSATWYGRALGIASDEGTGDDGEYDYEHMEYIRQELLAAEYHEVDQVYATDPEISYLDVMQSIETGVSVVNYAGHGSNLRWASPHFPDYRVQQLQNTDRWPAVVSVACDNGAFMNLDACFAETWLRASHEGEPTGAIAMYAATTLIGWSPPMEMQDEFNHLLASGTSKVFGGLCINGGLSMIEHYAWSGPSEMLCLAIFGDPSIRLRTMQPIQLAVEHPATYMPEDGSLLVSVSGAPGALAALSLNGVLVSSGYTDGAGQVQLSLPALGSPETLHLMVSADNASPYEAQIRQNEMPVLATPFGELEGPEDQTLELGGILDHFTDPDGDPLSLVEVSADITGFGFDQQVGSLLVMPPPNWNGEVTLTYSLSDGNYVIFADQRIEILPVNDLPVALQPFPTLQGQEDAPLRIADPLSGFRDIDGPGSLQLLDPIASHGSLYWDGTDLLFVAPPDFWGSTEIAFLLSDGLDSLACGPYPVQVLPANDAPQYFGDLDSYVVEEDGQLLLQLSELFGDIDGDSLAWGEYSIENGQLEFGGAFAGLHPAPDFHGELLLELSVSDGQESASSGAVTIEVLPVNDAPELLLDFEDGICLEDSLLQVANVYNHFRDVDGDSLQFSFSAEPGELSLQDSLLYYTPPQDYNGPVAITLSAGDGVVVTQANPFGLVVIPVQDALQLVLPFEQLQLEEDAPQALTDMLAHFHSIDGDSLWIDSFAFDPAGFSAELEGDSLWITPPADFSGSATLWITARTELPGDTLSAPVALQVQAVNDSPWAEFCGDFPEPQGDYEDFLSQMGLSFWDVDSDSLEFSWFLDGELLFSEWRAVEADTTWCAQAPDELADLLLPGLLHLELGDGEFILNQDGQLAAWELAGSSLAEATLPTEWHLDQNAPNPFNPSTRIRFGMPREGRVRLAIYNLRGQLVEQLLDASLPAGEHEEVWQPRGLASGVYLYVLQGQDFQQTRRLTLLK